MKFSVFTPSHDSRFLAEAYASLKAQTFINWEWVIVLNHGATFPEIETDARVRVYTAPDDVIGVGALKRYACEKCEGDYLVELDHDDLLLPEALERCEVAADVLNADFIYSDAANFRADGSFELFGKEWGWDTYAAQENGRNLQVNRSFPVNASTLRQIFYAPNHVRIWRKETYWAVGGHDASLSVCDDFDLLIRTYLSGAKFHHIEQCLYLYRLREDGGNTWLARNADVQTKQHELSNKYTQLLVHEWCRRERLLKLDLGGGTGCPEGYLSLDLATGTDLRQPWPYGDSSIGIVRAYDFLEHIPHCRDSSCAHKAPFCVVGMLNEIYRVLVPGGWLLSATPSTDGRGAFQDPTHCSFWNPNSFWYYTRTQQQQYVPGIKARFQGTRVWQEHPSEWHKLHEILYVYADLVALKGQRQPGIVEV
jgi:glycosyltransferase involved in cell wall biosynthesis